jgi:serine/threonine-protein kinase
MTEKPEPSEAPTALFDTSAAPLSFTIPATGAMAETLARFDPKTARRASLMSSLGANGPAPGRYETGALLGQGGMGVVLVAKDNDLARPVAIKQLKGDAPSAHFVERFLREAQITAQLEHPGIVPVHDVGADEAGHFYYVMRLVKGDQTLRRVIGLLAAGDPEAHRTFTFERRVRIIQQVAQILHYAHTRGVVHRDVKPDNIMVGPFGEVYLLDWGVAKVVGSAAEPVEVASPLGPATATAAGTGVGTPLYMAPEQARGEVVTARTDVYSLSAVLYELLTLKHYLDDPPSMQLLMQAIVESDPVAAEVHYDRRNGRVPRALSVICDRGLAKDPKKRFASASALEEALQRWSEGDTPILCPATFSLWILDKVRRTIIRHPVAFVVSLVTLTAASIAFAVWRYLGG